VDEVADTGKSLKLVIKHIFERGAKEVRIAAVYYKPWSVVKPDFYDRETSCWVVFPWEVKETIRKLIKKSKEKQKPVYEETDKLVKAGVPEELVERFLKEIAEEDGVAEEH
jgi:hypoxanthine phosphoribosyltransferase